MSKFTVNARASYTVYFTNKAGERVSRTGIKAKNGAEAVRLVKLVNPSGKNFIAQ
jgi:hypothetical protein